MVLYRCPTCQMTFAKKSQYVYHTEKRKNPCVVVAQMKKMECVVIPKEEENETVKMKNMECVYCDARMSRRDSLLRHMRTCRFAPKLMASPPTAHIITNNITNVVCVNNNIINGGNNNVIGNIVQTNEKKQMDVGGEVTTISPQLVQYGAEDLSRIANQSFYEAMSKNGYEIVTKMLEKIHFNPEIPEYKNVYISDLNREKTMMFDGEKWIFDEFENIYQDLLKKLITFIEQRHGELLEVSRMRETTKQRMERRLRQLNKIKLPEWNDDYEDENDVGSVGSSEQKQSEYLQKLTMKCVKNMLYNERKNIVQNYKLLSDKMKKQISE